MLPQLISFVKNFFQAFQTFLRSSLLALARNLIILPRRFSFVKNYFPELRSFVSDHLYQRRPADSLHILARELPFVKHFLQNSLSVFMHFHYIHLCVLGKHSLSFFRLINSRIIPSAVYVRFKIDVVGTIPYPYIIYSTFLKNKNPTLRWGFVPINRIRSAGSLRRLRSR